MKDKILGYGGEDESYYWDDSKGQTHSMKWNTDLMEEHFKQYNAECS